MQKTKIVLNNFLMAIVAAIFCLSMIPLSAANAQWGGSSGSSSGGSSSGSSGSSDSGWGGSSGWDGTYYAGNTGNYTITDSPACYGADCGNSSTYYAGNTGNYTITDSPACYGSNCSTYEEDWLWCGYVGCNTTYTYNPPYNPPSCSDQCSYSGQRTCSGNGYKICGNYDSDSCLEWSSVHNCASGQICSGGYCIESCTNECSVNGQKVCSGSNSWKQCGNYDSDSCLEWGSIHNCASDETCNNGSCVKTCTDECSVLNQRVCSGNGWKQCGNYDSDSCKEWGPINNCASDETCNNGSCVKTCSDKCILGQHQCSGSSGRVCGKFGGACTSWGSYGSCDSQCYSCGDGNCNSECGETKNSCPQDCGHYTPTVDLRYTGSVSCNQTATLTWTSANANSCSASGSWSGSKSTSGSESVGNFSGSKTYNLTCTGDGGTASDSVTLTGSADDLEVNAGSDEEIDYEDDDSLRLNGSVDGDYDSLRWTCTDGDLSDNDILRPTWEAPDYDDDDSRTYTCTLKATGECGSDSDSMRIKVNYENNNDFDVSLTARPKSDCAPLDNVDLIAKLSNYGNNDYDYTYYFDCENDGDWDKTVTVDDTDYTASNLCDYDNIGSYTAKVKVVSRGRTATDTEIVRAESCGIAQVGDASITKTVRNLSLGGDYQGTITANPLNLVSYKIAVSGTSGTSGNVILTDSIPAGITNIRDLQIDGNAQGGSLSSGIDLGTLKSGQTKTITYTATVANESNFGFGQNAINNTAQITVDGKSARSNAAVIVNRTLVMGATTISTGFSTDVLAGLGIALLASILCLGWVAKDRIALWFKKTFRQADKFCR